MRKLVSTLLTLVLVLSSVGAFAEVTPAGEFPIVTEPITLHLAVAKEGQVTDYINNSYTKYLEENTGVKLEIDVYPKDEANQKMEILIASGSKLPDAFVGSAFFGSQQQAVVYRHAQNGYFIQLDELIEKYGVNMMSMVEKVSNKNFMNMLKSPDGHIYALPDYQEQTSNEYSLRAYINKAWLDTLGLEIPTTTEELRTVLEAFKTQDPNGNGIADEIGVMGGGSWHQYAADYIMNAFVYDDGERRWYVQDGKLTTPYTTEQWREGLRYLHGLCEDGLFDPLSFTQDAASFKAIATSGDRNIVGLAVTAGMGQLFSASMSDRKSEYAPLGTIAGPEGVAWAARYPINPTPTMVITKDCEHPEALMRLADFMMSEESSVFSRFGEPGVDWVTPPEGSVALGEPWGATPEILPILIWGGSTHASHWNNVAPHILLQKYTDGQAWNGDPTDAEYMIALAVPGLMNREPAELCTLILYNEEESDEITDTKITLENYIKEAMARFVTGELDIEKDWDAYLNELNNIGLQRYVEISQQAYDRMMGRE